MKLSELSKHQRVSDLLRDLAHSKITVEQFWQEMRRYGLTDQDIDTLCSGKHVE